MSTTWSRYYDAAGEQPRETLLFALERFAAEAGAKKGGLFAVDLGCGTGRDTVELLRRGWRVLAIDAEAVAIQRLLRRGDLGSGEAARLATQVARFEGAEWPGADLINSSYALPFCPPNQFAPSGIGSSPRCRPAVASADNSWATATVGLRNPICPSRRARMLKRWYAGSRSSTSTRSRRTARQQSAT